MNYDLVVLFSASILVVGVIGAIRYRQIDPAYYPFIYCAWVASANEIISYILTRQGINTAVNNNIYELIETLIISWQFKRWGAFGKASWLYYLLLFSIGGIWMVDNIAIHGISRISMYLRVLFSFVVVILSINYNNQLISNYRRPILTSAAFLICSGYIIFFTYNILIEAFWWYGLNKSKNFRVSIFYVFTCINLFVNIIYIVAALWIPRKKMFIQPY